MEFTQKHNSLGLNNCLSCDICKNYHKSVGFNNNLGQNYCAWNKHEAWLSKEKSYYTTLI